MDPHFSFPEPPADELRRRQRSRSRGVGYRAAEGQQLLTSILRDVSRAFYLTLRVLPDGVREPVGLAYLLARAADTVADTAILAPADRLRHLLAFQEQVRGPASALALEEIRGDLRTPATAGEGALMAALPQAFALLEALAPPDREEVRGVVLTLASGMEMDLQTFPAEDSGALRALPAAADLERYTYLVAGCVVEFWTRIIAAHVPALSAWDVEGMAGLGVRLGQALQLTNILRDLPRDLRLGRCYLPEEELRVLGLAPEDLLDPASLARARPLLHHWVGRALDLYGAGTSYLLALPAREPRLRLAVLWPILLGLGTLARLVRSPGWLDPACRVKVGRGSVYRTVALSLPACFLDPVLRLWVRALRRRVSSRLSRLPG